MNTSQTFDSALSNWLTAHSLNRKRRTQEFNAEVVAVIRAQWSDLSIAAVDVDADMLLAFAPKVTRYCPSRWNAIVSALRFVNPAAKVLKFRRANSKHFVPPSQMQFASMLAECDSAPRTQAGLVVRFLSYTGMRINEARLLRWEDIKADRIEVPPNITKNSKGRVIPLLPGSADVLERLMCLDHNGYVLPRENARKAIQSACRRAGIGNMSHHSFRHLFATRCVESGVDIPTVSRWLGHRDGGALLAKTYFHLVDDHSRKMAAKVSIGA